MINKKKHRLAWLDICKGIAIICVVIGHVGTSYHNSGRFEDSLVINYAIRLVYGFHMPMFFVISGYLTTLSASDNQTNTIKKNIISYGIPYVVFSVLSWVIKVISSSFVNNRVVLKDLMRIPLYPLSSMWFLYALLLASIVHSLLKPIANTKSKATILIAISFVVRIIALNVTRNEVIISSGFDECILFSFGKYWFWYEVGAFCYENIIDYLCNVKGKVGVGITLVILITYFLVIYIFIINNYKNDFADTILGFIGIITVSRVSIQISKNKILEYIGKHTMPIYVLHPYFVSALRVVMSKLGVPLLNGVTPLIICSSCGVVVPLIVFSFFSRFKLVDFCFYPYKYLRTRINRNENRKDSL